MMKHLLPLILLGLAFTQASSPCSMERTLKVPLPSSTTLYIGCSNGVTIFRKCSNELTFDPKTNECLQSEDSRSLQVVQCPDDFNPAAPAFIAHPSDCTRYFICVQDIAHENQCPLGTKFNPTINLCDAAENVNCF